MSRWFNEDLEFRCQCGKPTCDAPVKPHRLLALYLDQARDMYGQAIIVTSGNRCKSNNLAVGGEDPSEHVWPEGCLGCDVRCLDGRQRFHLLEAFRHAGFRRLGVYARDGHLHVGIGDTVENSPFPADVVWVKP